MLHIFAWLWMCTMNSLLLCLLICVLFTVQIRACHYVCMSVVFLRAFLTSFNPQKNIFKSNNGDISLAQSVNKNACKPKTPLHVSQNLAQKASRGASVLINIQQLFSQSFK